MLRENDKDYVKVEFSAIYCQRKVPVFKLKLYSVICMHWGKKGGKNLFQHSVNRLRPPSTREAAIAPKG